VVRLRRTPSPPTTPPSPHRPLSLSLSLSLSPSLSLALRAWAYRGHGRQVGVSLGTSDTLVGISHTPAPRLHAHLMPHPSFPDAFFAMLVYKNGARARCAVCDAACGGAWGTLEASLAKSQPGNAGRLLLHLPMPEITPHILATGVHREDESGAPAPGPFSDDEEVRGVVEGRALSMSLHAQEIGIAFPPAKNKRVCKAPLVFSIQRPGSAVSGDG